MTKAYVAIGSEINSKLAMWTEVTQWTHLTREDIQKKNKSFKGKFLVFSDKFWLDDYWPLIEKDDIYKVSLSASELRLLEQEKCIQVNEITLINKITEKDLNQFDIYTDSIGYVEIKNKNLITLDNRVKAYVEDSMYITQITMYGSSVLADIKNVDYVGYLYVNDHAVVNGRIDANVDDVCATNNSFIWDVNKTRIRLKQNATLDNAFGSKIIAEQNCKINAADECFINAIAGKNEKITIRAMHCHIEAKGNVHIKASGNCVVFAHGKKVKIKDLDGTTVVKHLPVNQLEVL